MKRLLKINNTCQDIKNISITNMIKNSNNKKQVNLYGSVYSFQDRKLLVLHLTFGFTFLKFLRTFRFSKFITYPFFALPFFSLLFFREAFNPFLNSA